jgi:hypothetical protein
MIQPAKEQLLGFDTVVSSLEQLSATNAVLEERDRQDVKWGSQRMLSDREWLAILVEEVGEAAKDILDKKPDGLKVEVTQVAAVALAWLECLEAKRATHEALSGLENDDTSVYTPPLHYEV